MLTKSKIVQIVVSLLILMLSGPLNAMDRSQIQAQLFNQVLIGEVTFRDDIVSEALERLELMTPQDPRVIAARIRLLVRQDKMKKAKEALLRLGQIAPKSIECKKMATLIKINQPLGAKQVFQANVLVLSGNYAKAKQLLDKLYNGNPPTLKLAIDYWTIVSKIPEERHLAVPHLQTYYFKLKKLGVISDQLADTEEWQDSLPKTLSNIYVNEGKTLLEQNELSKASSLFQKALDIYPKNYNAIIGLGSIEFKKQNYSAAKSTYEKATQLYPERTVAYFYLVPVYEQRSPQAALTFIKSLPPFIQQKLILATKRLKSKILYRQADNYSHKGKWSKALELYKQALKLQPDDIWITYQIALANAKLGKINDGISAMKHLSLKKQNDPEFVFAFALYYWKLNQKASSLKQLKTLPRTKWTEDMVKLYNQIHYGQLQEQADLLVKKKRWHQAIVLYKKIYRSQPDNVWLIYDYAIALNQVGHRSKALSIFQQLARQKPNNAEQAYAFALFLSKIDYTKRALKHLNTIPYSKWDASMKELAGRLKDSIHINYASSLRNQGFSSQATQYLMRQRPSDQILLTLARWELEDDHLERAYHYYRQVLQRSPENMTAYVGLIKTYIADKEYLKAHDMLTAIQPRVKQLVIDQQRSIANAWLELGQPNKAIAIFKRIVPIAKKQPPSQETALIFRDAATMDASLNQPKLARKNYEWAMVHSGITSSLPTDDEVYTTLTRNNPQDDWLKRSIRYDAGELYQAQSHVATLEHDYWQVKGSPGSSEYEASDAIIHYRSPYRDGIFHVRGDMVTLSAGRFASQNGVFFDEFGTCQVGCRRDFNQKASGFGIMAGWFNDTWIINLGVTPIGFDIVNPIVELGYNGEFNNINWTLSALHTPLTNSLLSFSGARDPNTGTTWGGVTSTGLNLALSHDLGGKHGFWGNVLASYLRGKNVATNNRVELMGGYYYKIINEDNRRLTVGLTGLLWHYQKDLNQYTLGSGGYYSPQRFISFLVPVNYYHRTQNWSFMAETSLGWSIAKENNGLLYPIPSLVPNPLVTPNPIRASETTESTNYYFLLGLERRLSSHFRLGGIVDIQRTPNFAPNHILIYLRYTLEPWQGDLHMPLRPIPPLTEYR